MAAKKPRARATSTLAEPTARQKEGTGAVPNVTPGQDPPKVEQLKEAMHELEEKKGDWGKSH
jgi:hypothetical protein